MVFEVQEGSQSVSSDSLAKTKHFQFLKFSNFFARKKKEEGQN